MPTIYQIGTAGYWTGASREIGPKEGAPRGWTRTAIPQLAEGEYAVWGAGGWRVTEQAYAPRLINAKRTRMLAVDTLRDQHIALGCTADVNGDGTLMVPIDLRNDIDFRNVNGFGTNALAAKQAGVTAAVLDFRGADDVTYELTPDQGIILGVAAARWVGKCYKRAWALKDQIASASTVPAVLAIDITTGWPE